MIYWSFQFCYVAAVFLWLTGAVLLLREFFGEYRGEQDKWNKAHESPRSMTVPLMILAGLAVIGGWIGDRFPEEVEILTV